MAERFDVPVDGGTLAVWRWGGTGPVVLAAHGITSSHRAWSAVGEQGAGQLTLIAPDLRGRGDSADVAGPSSMARHADDLAAVLDHVDVAAAVVAGHSMGGWVATAFATTYPDRTRAVVLVDGGPRLFDPLPADADADAVMEQVVGPAVQRLRQRFDSRDEYRRFWHDHPALRDSDVPPARIDAYADHDLYGPVGDMRSKVSEERVREDTWDTLINDAVPTAIAEVDAPAVLLLAERGMLGDETPLFTDGRLAGVATARGPLEMIRVPDTNHYTVLLGDRGAGAVAHHLTRFATTGQAG